MLAAARGEPQHGAGGKFEPGRRLRSVQGMLRSAARRLTHQEAAGEHQVKAMAHRRDGLPCSTAARPALE